MSQEIGGGSSDRNQSLPPRKTNDPALYVDVEEMNYQTLLIMKEELRRNLGCFTYKLDNSLGGGIKIEMARA
ncbi:hypothetical protein TNCT_142401 [Trichonephila clavata]|uniref:Uncharacterized protein n=1 Tax=Trichonephila clavata TaxID=2740835 RepID=A0A8X6KY31_TRICU|nr:hypothetical protein TNCT_142401 [Trichonephila clavata]